jgi:predicted CXXCH cytochrome family protein
MSAAVWFLVLGVPALLVLPQLRRALGPARGTPVGLAALLVLGGGWLGLEWPHYQESATPRDLSAVPSSATSESCFKCHEASYTSWYRTYHRTMTREATPDYVKGDFNNATFLHRGITSRMTRQGDTFFMDTADPAWAERMLQTGKPPEDWGPPRLRRFQVDRLVGSHWFQECLHKDAAGRYWRLPVSYHIVEQRWVHTNGAFLAPDTDDFYGKSAVWNETCVFCHNTKPSKRPQPPRAPGPPGYQTQVAELGIACEACHGPGEEHVRVNHNPARRFALQRVGTGDPTIVNPARLPVERRDHVCAHCHGAPLARVEAWNPVVVTDPFTAGEDLTHSYHLFWSSAEQQLLNVGKRSAKPARPEPLDGRFWGDGTPLTTSLEYQGMALSACYEGGHGRLSCLSCHSMHHSDPNFLLARRMDTNEACYQCHDGYRQRLAEHTHHAADSPGSLCYNCHMPYQVYSLLTTHRSHRIEVPRVRDSLGTGKPHACNLCHLDKSLGWTQDRLAEWYSQRPEPLPDHERQYASALLHLCQSDARSRAVVAGAFSWPAAHQAAGTDWAGPLLAHVLEHERYPAVRYLAYRGLRTLYGPEAGRYDYLAGPAERAAQLRTLRPRLEARCRPDARRYPQLPLHPDGRIDGGALERLLRHRNDPDVIIHE